MQVFFRKGFVIYETEGGNMVFTVAIDGPAGAGKGTVAKHIGEQFSFDLLDTGLLYREAARLVIEENIDVLDILSLEAIAKKVNPSEIEPSYLRNENIASIASKIAVVPSLRGILTQKMQDFACNIGELYQGVVLDGRDVGTVILPDANVKIYLTADEQVRAYRRTKELGSAAKETLQHILEEIKTRDARDSTRQTAPLQIADDAIVIDTTFLSVDDACVRVASLVEKALALYQLAHK